MDLSEALARKHLRVEEVYRGEGLWVLNKPVGLLSHPNPPGKAVPNAILQVAYDFKEECFLVGESEAEAGRRRPQRIYLLHRLDQDTSGLILLALDAELAARLKEMFYHREVSKEYHALVKGVPRRPEGTWRDELRKRRRQGQIRVDVVRQGRPNAETHYRIQRIFSNDRASLLALQPETGRTHQLRVQTAARRHPVAGDGRYGDFAWNRELKHSIGLKRMFLHARRLQFRHPKTGRRLKFTAEGGPSLDEPLARLGT